MFEKLSPGVFYKLVRQSQDDQRTSNEEESKMNIDKKTVEFSKACLWNLVKQGMVQKVKAPGVTPCCLGQETTGVTKVYKMKNDLVLLLFFLKHFVCNVDRERSKFFVYEEHFCLEHSK